MSCKWCAMGQCWGCKSNPQEGGKGQKRGGNFGGPGGKRGNYGGNSDADMMAGMMMAMMSQMSGGRGGGWGGGKKKGGGGDFSGRSQKSPQSSQPWKGELQKALKADGKAAATFESEEVDKAARKWTAIVTIDGEQAEGRGRGKADSEHSAARNAMRQLYPNEHAELTAKINASKVAGGAAAADPKARLHHGTQLFVRRQYDRNMTPDDIKYTSDGNTATVTLPEELEGPYVGEPNADKTKAEESAALAALERCQDVFDELQRDATAKKEQRQQERQAKFAETERDTLAEAQKPKIGVKKAPMVGFAGAKKAAKKEAPTVQKKPMGGKLSISLNK